MNLMLKVLVMIFVLLARESSSCPELDCPEPSEGEQTTSILQGMLDLQTFTLTTKRNCSCSCPLSSLDRAKFGFSLCLCECNGTIPRNFCEKVKKPCSCDFITVCIRYVLSGAAPSPPIAAVTCPAATQAFTSILPTTQAPMTAVPSTEPPTTTTTAAPTLAPTTQPTTTSTAAPTQPPATQAPSPLPATPAPPPATTQTRIYTTASPDLTAEIDKLINALNQLKAQHDDLKSQSKAALTALKTQLETIASDPSTSATDAATLGQIINLLSQLLDAFDSFARRKRQTAGRVNCDRITQAVQAFEIYVNSQKPFYGLHASLFAQILAIAQSQPNLRLPAAFDATISGRSDLNVRGMAVASQLAGNLTDAKALKAIVCASICVYTKSMVGSFGVFTNTKTMCWVNQFANYSTAESVCRLNGMQLFLISTENESVGLKSGLAELFGQTPTTVYINGVQGILGAWNGYIPTLWQVLRSDWPTSIYSASASYLTIGDVNGTFATKGSDGKGSLTFVCEIITP